MQWDLFFMETTANKLLFLSGYIEFPTEIKILIFHSNKVCELVYKPETRVNNSACRLIRNE